MQYAQKKRVQSFYMFIQKPISQSVNRVNVCKEKNKFTVI